MFAFFTSTAALARGSARGGQVGALALLWLLSPAALAEQFQLKSPDGRIEINLETGAQLQYQLQVDGTTVLAPSPISLQFADGIQYGPAGTVQKQSRRSENQQVQPEVPVRTATIRDQYNELALEFDQPFVLRVRAYNEGIAWRLKAANLVAKPNRART
ncbi:MAG: glycoside hydrolase family 97 N-terminal domain-containing protein [Rheinheimera sp.]|nr:glycoside hydrolase family 97 N-terminal domain-containing protein [Rheinheimera sp.]